MTAVPGMALGRGSAYRLPSGRTGIPNAILAVGVVIFTEIMFFAALLSAYFVARSYASAWPPLGQPRLPVGVTAANSAVLLASGAFAWFSLRGGAKSRRDHLLALAGGIVFVAVQGGEWTRLIGHGLTLASGSYGSFFYLLIGAHALHAVAGILALGILVPGPARLGAVSDQTRRAALLYWLFVCGLWPVLYVLVYLA